MSRLDDLIVAAHQSDPKKSWNDLATECNCSRSKVGQVLKANGLKTVRTVTGSSSLKARARFVMITVEGELDPPEVADIIARALDRRRLER